MTQVRGYRELERQPGLPPAGFAARNGGEKIDACWLVRNRFHGLLISLRNVIGIVWRRGLPALRIIV